MDESRKQSSGLPNATLPTAFEKPMRQASSPGGLMANALVGTLLGRYQLGQQLGVGGMGAVYEATHVDIGKVVAVKILSTQLAADPRAHERFRREATNLSRLVHPHIVNVTDFGEESGTPYLVMERLHGEDLADHLSRQPRGMMVSAAADTMLPVCAAVVAAHEASIIHRDLKPRNIFLAKNPVDEIQPKVLDFGISRLTTESPGTSLTDSGALLGTVPYLPPEHIKGGQCDARSDQYTLGVVLFECLTGRHPHDGQTPLVIMQEIAAGRFFRPSAFRPDIPVELEKVLLRAMSQDPLGRYASVFELGRNLLTFASAREQVIWAKYFSGSDLTLGAVNRIQSTAPLQIAPAAVPDPIPQADAVALGSTRWGARKQPAEHETDRVQPSTGRMRRALFVLGGLTMMAAVVGLSAKRWKFDVLPSGASRSPVATTTLQPPVKVRELTAAPASSPGSNDEVSIQVVGAPADSIAKLDGWPTTLPLRIPRENRRHELTIWAPAYEPSALVFEASEDRQLHVDLKPLAGAAQPAPKANEAALDTVTVKVQSRPPHAEVWVKGESSSRGRTPLSMKFTKSDRPLQVSVRLSGFQSDAKAVVLSANRAVDFRLRRASSPQAEEPREDAANLQLLRLDD